MICALKDLFKARHIGWLPSARIALETMYVSSSEGGEEVVEYWMASVTYYSQLWMIKCEVQVQRCNYAIPDSNYIIIDAMSFITACTTLIAAHAHATHTHMT